MGVERLPQPTWSRPRQATGTTRSNDAPRRMNKPSFANSFSFGSEPLDRFACSARPVGSATASRMMDDPDGGATSEAITSWQPSMATGSAGVGAAIEVETHAVAVTTSTLIGNQAKPMNGR